MQPKIIIFAVLALFVILAPVMADNTIAEGWSAPVVLGSGSEPVLKQDANGRLSVRFEGDEQAMTAGLQENGSWTTPEPVGSEAGANALQIAASDTQWLVENIDGAILFSFSGSGSVPGKKEVVVEKREKTYLTLLHFSADSSGALHLLYGRTPEYDTASENQGMDVSYRRYSGSDWEKELPVVAGLIYSRTWQKPGIAITPQGRVFICSYNDLYSFDKAGEVRKETCPIADFSMPLAVVANGSGTLHFVFHASRENAETVDENLYYVTKTGDEWSKPVSIGKQPTERLHSIFLAAGRELYVAWEDPDGNIMVSKKQIE